MTKKPIAFTSALAQTTIPKKRGRPAYKYEQVRKRLEKTGEWDTFREALVDENVPQRAIQEALARSGIKVCLPTVARWRSDAIYKNRLIWAQVDRDMALAELDKVMGDK